MTRFLNKPPIIDDIRGEVRVNEFDEPGQTLTVECPASFLPANRELASVTVNGVRYIRETPIIADLIAEVARQDNGIDDADTTPYNLCLWAAADEIRKARMLRKEGA